MTGMFSKPKIDTRAADRAEASAIEAEKKAKEAERVAAADAEYRRKLQAGKSSTLLSVDDGNGRSLLGG